MRRTIILALVVGAVAAFGQTAAGAASASEKIEIESGRSAPGPAERIAAAAITPQLGSLLAEVLRRNPETASAAARARAADQRAPQARSLPDPTASIAVYLMTPETRVGPQQAMATLAQRIPWFGKLSLRERVAVAGAVAAWAEVEAKELALVTETQRLFWELAFLDAWEETVRLDRETLIHYEKLARSRYSAGIGIQQAAIKLQAEVTKAANRLLEIANRRAALVASINALRDLPGAAPIERIELPAPVSISADPEFWRAEALASRPEISRADAEIEQARAAIELAKKEYFPDITAGITYTMVGPRTDLDAGMVAPAGNGDDIFGVSAGVNLPIWRKRLEAGVEEAIERRNAAEEMRRAVVTSIDASLGELAQRIELTGRQIVLFDDVLLVQAEQALGSAVSAYGAGSLSAL
ncbi:MAG: TolC family protein, partial [Acidobacteria bacterium]|nr:TolC family protein [Acidobacteriota bacterium]